MAHVISFRPLLSSGNCKLTMEDSYGDGWNGAEWSVPGLNLGPFSMPVGSTYTAEVSFNVPPGDTGWIQSEAVAVNSDSFRFVYVPPESSPPLSTAAIAQIAVCCHPPAASSTTFDLADGSLFTPPVCPSSPIRSAFFEYHMYGEQMGTLSLKDAEGVTRWSRIGQQAKGSDYSNWMPSGEVPLAGSASLSFRYEGAFGPLGNAAIAKVVVCCPIACAAQTEPLCLCSPPPTPPPQRPSPPSPPPFPPTLGVQEAFCSMPAPSSPPTPSPPACPPGGPYMGCGGGWGAPPT